MNIQEQNSLVSNSCERRSSCPEIFQEKNPLVADSCQRRASFSDNLFQREPAGRLRREISAPKSSRKLLLKRGSCPDLGRLDTDVGDFGSRHGYCISQNIVFRRIFWKLARAAYAQRCAESPPTSLLSRFKLVMRVAQETVKRMIMQMKIIEVFRSNAEEKRALREMLAHKKGEDGLSDSDEEEKLSEKDQTSEQQPIAPEPSMPERPPSAPIERALSPKSQIKAEYLSNLLPTVTIVKNALRRLQALVASNLSGLEDVSSQLDNARAAIQSAVEGFWSRLQGTMGTLALDAPVDSLVDKLDQFCEQLKDPEWRDFEAALNVADEIGNMAEVVEQAVKTELSVEPQAPNATCALESSFYACKQSIKERRISDDAEDQQAVFFSEASLSTSISDSADAEQGALFSEASLLTCTSEPSEEIHVPSGSQADPDVTPNLVFQIEGAGDADGRAVDVADPSHQISFSAPLCEESSDSLSALGDAFEKSSPESSPTSIHSAPCMLEYNSPTRSSKLPKLIAKGTPEGRAGKTATQFCVHVLKDILQGPPEEEEETQQKGLDKEEIGLLRDASELAGEVIMRMPSSPSRSGGWPDSLQGRKSFDESSFSVKCKTAWEAPRETNEPTDQAHVLSQSSPARASKLFLDSSQAQQNHNDPSVVMRRNPALEAQHEQQPSQCQTLNKSSIMKASFPAHSANPMRTCLPHLQLPASSKTSPPMARPSQMPRRHSVDSVFSKRNHMEGACGSISQARQSPYLALDSTLPRAPPKSDRSGKFDGRRRSSLYASNDKSELLSSARQHRRGADKFCYASN